MGKNIKYVFDKELWRHIQWSRIKIWQVAQLYRITKDWKNNKEYRDDINFRRWGIPTIDIKGSRCGCCGKYIKGDPGEPDTPPDWRWTLCDRCIYG
jgi:Iap family predicted aminopeptidase